ncbi:MAG: C25 family cysteine peptidase [Candidatus Thermoplasmatota archaeon]|nr:C25 family cysteine peptidase [Candidatus Thermoplasmatota archaeon]
MKAKVLSKPIFAIGTIAMFCAAVFSGCVGPGTGNAGANAQIIGPDDMQALAGIETERNPLPDDCAIVASDADSFYAIIAAPVAAYYEEGQMSSVPLLVANDGNTYPWVNVTPNNPSEPTKFSNLGPVARFLMTYNPTSGIVIGMDKFSAKGSEASMGTVTPVEYALPVKQAFPGEVQEAALAVASAFWSKSEAAIIVDIETGYAEAVNAGVLASYLNIPIIPVSSADSAVADALSGLGVKYTILCGEVNVPGSVAESFGTMLKFSDLSQIADAVLEILPSHGYVGSDLPYVVMANPLDINVPNVLNETKYNFTGSIADKAQSGYPGMPEGLQGIPFNVTVPDDYKYANFVMDLKMDATGVTGSMGAPDPMATPDNSGTRIYIYIYKKSAGGEDTLEFFAPSQSYDFERDASGKPIAAYLHTELLQISEPGDYSIQVGSASLTHDDDLQAQFKLDVKVQKLEGPTYPLMPGLSSMAPYLAAIHKGIVLANPEFALQVSGLGGCVSCGDPAADSSAITEANRKAIAVHDELVSLLGKITGVGDDVPNIASVLSKDPDNAPYIAILADPNMVPMYYYVGSVGEGVAGGGEGIPGDVFYATVDPNLVGFEYNPNVAMLDSSGEPMTGELAVSRITGYDAQDASALIARSNFYARYLAGYAGQLNVNTDPVNEQTGYSLTNFGDLAYVGLGSEPPIESEVGTVAELITAFARAGMRSTAGTGDLAALALPLPVLGGLMNAGVKTLDNSGRQGAGTTWESSNFIWMVVHGFWYWFCPDAMQSLAPNAAGISSGAYGGTAFDVSRTKYMTMGPSVMFFDSCITARTDGLKAYNTLSTAFMHAGVNAYVGGTRSMYGPALNSPVLPIPYPMLDKDAKLGSYMAKVFFSRLAGYIVSDVHTEALAIGVWPCDMDIGHAMLLARNDYAAQTGLKADDTICTMSAVVLYGDPAFNPYESNHEGGLALP